MPGEIVTLETAQICADCGAALGIGAQAKRYVRFGQPDKFYCYPVHLLAPSSNSSFGRKQKENSQQGGGGGRAPTSHAYPRTDNPRMPAPARDDIHKSVALKEAVHFCENKLFGPLHDKQASLENVSDAYTFFLDLLKGE